MSTIPEGKSSVDAGALANAVWGHAARALAASAVLTIDWCEEDGHELNQKQKIQLVYATLQAGANLEAVMARDIVSDLERNGVEVWGLSSELASLVRVAGENNA